MNLDVRYCARLGPPEVSAFAPLSVAQRTSKALRRRPDLWVHALTDQHPHFMSAADQRADEPHQQEDVGDAIGWIRPQAMPTDLLPYWVWLARHPIIVGGSQI